MGIAPSKDNEELVDTLVKAGHLRSPQIELAFRLVDRGNFVPKKYIKEIYGDQPFKVPESDSASWTPGYLHISAPCMYACVLEKLDIKKGNAFLNVGSGSGWLNTVCGFLVGEKGINHGVEIHSNLVDYADNLMNSKTILSGAVAGFEWCKPKFMHGNGLTLKNADGFEGYDRIYCGASIRDPNTVFRLMRLLKVGGRMVAPFHSVLFSFNRVSVSTIRTENVTNCQFADLILPESRTPLRVLFTCYRPMSLKLICRYYIRQELRKKTDCSHDFVVSLKITKEKEPQNWSTEDFRHTSFGGPLENTGTSFQAVNPRLVPHSFLAAHEFTGRPFSSFFRPGINPENPEVPGTEDYLLPLENEEQKALYIEYPLSRGESEDDEGGAVNDVEFHRQQLDDETFLDNILGFAARHIGAAEDREAEMREAEEEAREVVRQFSRVTHGRVTIEPPVDASLNLMDGRTRRFRFVQDGTQNNIYGVLDPTYPPFDIALNGSQAQMPRLIRRSYNEANASTSVDTDSERSTSPKRVRWDSPTDNVSESTENIDEIEHDNNKLASSINENANEHFCDCSVNENDDQELNEVMREIETTEERKNKRREGKMKFSRLPDDLLRAYGSRYQEILASLPIPNHLTSFVRLEK